MPFLRDNVNDTLALLPQTTADALECERLACTRRAADPDVAVRIFIVVIGVQKDRRTIVHIETEEDTVAVGQLIGREWKRRRYAAGERISAGFALNVRIKIENWEHGQERLLLLVLAASGDHVHGDTELFHRCNAMLQRFRVTSRDLDERVHIVKILALPVHHVLEVHTGRDGAVQLLEVLPGVRNVTHPAAVHHGLLGDLRQDFFFGLLVKMERNADAFTGLDQRSQPACADGRGIAVARDVKIGMKNAVHYNVVPAFGVHARGRENVQNCCRTRFQLAQVRRFLAEQQTLEKRLLLRLFLNGRLCLWRQAGRRGGFVLAVLFQVMRPP